MRRSSMRRVSWGTDKIIDLSVEAGASFTSSDGLSFEDHMDRCCHPSPPWVRPFPSGQRSQCIFELRIEPVLQFDLAVDNIPLDALKVVSKILLLHRDALLLLVADFEQQVLFRQLHVGPLIATPCLGLSRVALLDFGEGEAHTRGRDVGMSVEIADAMVEWRRLTPHVHPLEGMMELIGAGKHFLMGRGRSPKGIIHHDE